MADRQRRRFPRPGEWVVGHGGVPWNVPLYLPSASGGCDAMHPQAYVCTRRPGHTGRHAACGEDDAGRYDVIAVWH